jgi:hypothetical protein
VAADVARCDAVYPQCARRVTSQGGWAHVQGRFRRVRRAGRTLARAARPAKSDSAVAAAAREGKRSSSGAARARSSPSSAPGRPRLGPSTLSAAAAGAHASALAARPHGARSIASLLAHRCVSVRCATAAGAWWAAAASDHSKSQQIWRLRSAPRRVAERARGASGGAPSSACRTSSAAAASASARSRSSSAAPPPPRGPPPMPPTYRCSSPVMRPAPSFAHTSNTWPRSRAQ